MILNQRKSEGVWNPTTGCTKVSEGCDSCPALWDAYREKKSFDFSTDLYKFPPEDKEVVHVSLGSDLFHDSNLDDLIRSVFFEIRKRPYQKFIILTKRVERMTYMDLEWPENLIGGVTVETQKQLWRVDYLRDSNVQQKLVSFCPLLEEIANCNLSGIDFASIALETWGLERTGSELWVKSLQDQCGHFNVRVLGE